MEPVVVVTWDAAPLYCTDVDTTILSPSNWLKRVERTGFGGGLVLRVARTTRQLRPQQPAELHDPRGRANSAPAPRASPPSTP